MRKRRCWNSEMMDHPVSHSAAMVGAGALFVLLFCGLMMVENRDGCMGSGWWWAWVLGATGMLGLSAGAYLWPGSWWGWGLVAVLPGGTMLALVGTLWRVGLVKEGFPVIVVVGLVWVWWVCVRVSAILKERREEGMGFEVGEGRKAVDER